MGGGWGRVVVAMSVNSSFGYVVCFFVSFPGAVAKMKKVTISFVVLVRLSACNNSAPSGRISMKFGVWRFLENLSSTLKFH